MRHLNEVGDSNYDLRAFRADPLGRITFHGGGGGKNPDPPPPPPPPPAPEAEVKDPETDTMIKQKKTRMAQDPMPAQTMLTGPEGIDQNSLNLGKNSLLGG